MGWSSTRSVDTSNAKHLQRYINEFAGRQNVRYLDTIAQMVLLAKCMERKRLHWQDLVS